MITVLDRRWDTQSSSSAGSDVYNSHEYDRAIDKELKVLVGHWQPLLGTWKDEFERLGLEDIRRV